MVIFNVSFLKRDSYKKQQFSFMKNINETSTSDFILMSLAFRRIFVILLLTLTKTDPVQRQDSKERESLKTKQYVVTLNSIPSSSNCIQYGIFMQFNLSSIPDYACVRKAKLCVYQRNFFSHYISKPFAKDTYLLSLLEKRKFWFHSEDVTYLTHQLINAGYEGWWKIDITSYICNWVRKRELIQDLCLILTNSKGEAVPPELFGLAGFQPFIKVHYQPFIRVYLTELPDNN